MIKDVEDLKIYQLSLELLDKVYDLVNQIPVSHLKLRKQILNAAESIAPLVAEGFGKKRSEKEFKRFLEMALGSSDEMISHLRIVKILSKRYHTININLCDYLLEQYKILSKQTQCLIKNWVTY